MTITEIVNSTENRLAKMFISEKEKDYFRYNLSTFCYLAMEGSYPYQNIDLTLSEVKNIKVFKSKKTEQLFCMFISGFYKGKQHSQEVKK